MTARIDMEGKRFARLVVLRRGNSNAKGKAMWVCACDCGRLTEVLGTYLRTGVTKSCGCLRGEVGRATRELRTKHGFHGTPTYASWSAMNERCRNPKVKEYPRYGGRGIGICARWSDFANFLADMGERPTGMTLDRIDVNGDYEPGNCRWATDLEQARNRGTNVLLTYGGREQCITAWADELGMGVTTLRARLARGWDMEKIVQTPVMPYRPRSVQSVKLPQKQESIFQ
ncbi:hypothetical protein [Ralstonia mannitolilytica]|uniref:hypothetical protein n=1 Tax=Ralstonia mannitolilytica TaxID=105219 RepID=UPI0026EAFC44|nr:hypothetical protein [Ralstonia mannitolilytica]